MTARSRPEPPTPRPLSNWTIAAGALVLLGVVAVVWFVLLRRYGSQGAQIQLDAIRTAGTLVVGTGGAVALLLTARRQRYTELTLVHTTRDAAERRITELYTKAADQLGSDKAPVRLAGLHALERLAQDTPEQRQTIVDVICAYLRMPYTPPDERPPAEDALAEAHERYENRRQEQQVRLTAQNILSRNLRVGQGRQRWWHRTPPNVLAWRGIGLDLAGAFLLEFSLANCLLDYANFTNTQFVGEANFETYFTGKVSFRSAQFTGKASFVDAQFTGEASFAGAQFTGEASFARTEFTNLAFFEGAKFAMVHFGHAQFAYGASFKGTHFTGEAYFGDVQFTGGAYFGDAQFTGGALFMGARFSNHLADFRHVQFTDGADFRDTRFTGGATFEDAQFTGGANFEDARFVDIADFLGSQFTGGAADYTRVANFRDTQFIYTHFDLPDFAHARVVASAAGLDSVWPPDWTTRPAKPDIGEDPAFLYLTEVEEGTP